MKQPTRTLADLRPNATIQCGYCGETKPQAGSEKFHALLICAPCASKLQALSDNQPRKSKS